MYHGMGQALRAIVLLALLLLPLACGNPETAGGSTDVESGAKLSGRVQHLDGNPADGTELRLLPSTFDSKNEVIDPTTALRKVTYAGSDGSFAFSGLDSGSYSVEAYHSGAHTRTLLTRLSLHGADSIDLGSNTLHTPGFVHIVLPLSGPLAGENGDGLLYVPGTTIRARVDSLARSKGEVFVDSVPAAVPVELWFLPDTGAYAPTMVIDSVVTSPRDTLLIWMAPLI